MQYSQRGAFAETRREQHGNDDRRQNEFGIGIGKQGAQSLIPTSSSGRTATMSQERPSARQNSATVRPGLLRK